MVIFIGNVQLKIIRVIQMNAYKSFAYMYSDLFHFITLLVCFYSEKCPVAAYQSATFSPTTFSSQYSSAYKSSCTSSFLFTKFWLEKLTCMIKCLNVDWLWAQDLNCDVAAYGLVCWVQLQNHEINFLNRKLQWFCWCFTLVNKGY